MVACGVQYRHVYVRVMMHDSLFGFAVALYVLTIAALNLCMYACSARVCIVAGHSCIQARLRVQREDSADNPHGAWVKEWEVISDAIFARLGVQLVLPTAASRAAALCSAERRFGHIVEAVRTGCPLCIVGMISITCCCMNVCAQCTPTCRCATVSQ
jgi:hypothetical protein